MWYMCVCVGGGGLDGVGLMTVKTISKYTIEWEYLNAHKYVETSSNQRQNKYTSSFIYALNPPLSSPLSRFRQS